MILNFNYYYPFIKPLPYILIKQLFKSTFILTEGPPIAFFFVGTNRFCEESNVGRWAPGKLTVLAGNCDTVPCHISPSLETTIKPFLNFVCCLINLRIVKRPKKGNFTSKSNSNKIKLCGGRGNNILC